jgi:hypothetical protein
MPANYETMTNPLPGSDLRWLSLGGKRVPFQAGDRRGPGGQGRKGGGSCSGAVVADSAHEEEEEEVGSALAWASEG